MDKEAVQEFADPRIIFIQSDCAGWLEANARSNIDLARPCLLVEDFHGELSGFFEHIGSILKTGDYRVIEDSNPKQSTIARTIAGLPYAVDTKYTDFFGIKLHERHQQHLRQERVTLKYNVVEDQAGFEPAMSLRCRLKRPARSAATVTGPMIVLVEDASGYDPQADGLKIRSLSIRV